MTCQIPDPDFPNTPACKTVQLFCPGYWATACAEFTGLQTFHKLLAASVLRGEGRVSTQMTHPSCHWGMAGMGHEDAFPRPRLSARCRFSQGTFAGTRGNGRDAHPRLLTRYL